MGALGRDRHRDRETGNPKPCLWVTQPKGCGGGGSTGPSTARGGQDRLPRGAVAGPRRMRAGWAEGGGPRGGGGGPQQRHLGTGKDNREEACGDGGRAAGEQGHTGTGHRHSEGTCGAGAPRRRWPWPGSCE